MAKKKKAKGSNDEAATGRPKVKIDRDRLLALAKIQATEEEAAAFFGCTKRTIINRLKEPALLQAWTDGKALGRISLRRRCWHLAHMDTSGGVTMAIHLSKHWLGQTERAALELSGPGGAPIEVSSARERVTRKLDALSERIARRVDGLAAAAGAKALPREPVRN